MEDKNSELLFEYLRSILYDSQVKELDIKKLDEPFVKLGKGLLYLQQLIQEMKEYSADLSKGNLSVIPPSKDNPLCENLKNMHSNLNHLTWQAKQVAKGDYSQTVSFLGEFSEAFNMMTGQLKEREQALKNEVLCEKNHAQMVENYNNLLQTLIWHSKGDVLIISVDNPRILYASNNNITSEKKQELFNISINKTHEFNFPERKMLSDNSYIWEVEDSERNFYRITTNNITWQQESAYANIIFDITEEKLAKSELEYKAYFDRLTKIGNRYYFYARVNDLLRLHESLVFCYCDLDHLKYINDNYGHDEGDKYLCSFVNTINDIIREVDMFARIGGDEFCIILRDCSKQDAYNKLEKAQKEFVSNNNEVYSKNFSFGIVSLPENHGIVNIDTVIHEADNSMYEQKKLHKQLDKQKSE